MELTPEIKKWIINRVNGCLKRALNQKPPAVWRSAIKKAVAASDGKCPYTGVRLDFTLPSYDPFYPSLDHKSSLASADLGVTIRLVNDMKSIMSEDEFLKMVAHIYRYRIAKTAKAPANHKLLAPGRAFKKGNIRY